MVDWRWHEWHCYHGLWRSLRGYVIEIVKIIIASCGV
jgi:hypothetical protein